MGKEIKIPQSKRKKALFIIDLQPRFVKKIDSSVIRNIVHLLKEIKYDFYVESIFYAGKNSMWEKQQKRTFSKENNMKTVSSIKEILSGLNPLRITKNKKSIFKGNKKLFDELKERKIKEIHLVGLDTNDCILASSYESFDLQFFTYVIEECCAHSEKDPSLHKKALNLLRYERMTNNSVKEKMRFKILSIL